MDLDKAVRMHEDWNRMLRAAIASRERLDSSSMARDSACALGEWLRGEGRARLGRSALHAACVEKHAVFHAEAARVARVINAGDYEAAHRLLDDGSRFVAATRDFTATVGMLKQEAGSPA